MSRILTTEAVVLGSRRLGEADRIADLFTEALGRVPTVVKGVRKVGSRWGGRLEPLTRLQVQLHPGRTLHTLTGADTITTFEAVRIIPVRLRAAQSVMEMISRSTPEHQRKPRTYNLLLRFLGELAKPDDVNAGERVSLQPQEENSSGVDRIQTLALAAELKVLLLAGFLPHLLSCAECGGEDNLEFFSAAAGGALCTKCRGGAFTTGPDAIASMRFLLESPLASAGASTPSLEVRRKILRAVREICEYHLGVRLRVDPW